MPKLSIKERLESFGGTVVEITVNGITFFAVGFRIGQSVDVYNVDGDKVASAAFHSDTESASIVVDGDESQSSELYFQNDSKTEYDLAYDVGTYLAALL